MRAQRGKCGTDLVPIVSSSVASDRSVFTLPFMFSHILERHVTEGLRINLLKPTGHVMHRQFNIQQLYVLPTLYLSENKQRLVPLTA